MSKTKSSTSSTRSKELLAFAQKLKDSGANWVQANNAIYGKGGKFAELFPTASARTVFTKSKSFKQLSQLLATFPEPQTEGELVHPLSKASGQLRVRMPKSIHAALIEEAASEGVSLNQLIVSKLSLQLRASI